MDLTLLILAGVLLVLGLLGAVLPVLPGLPFSYAGLLVFWFSSYSELSVQFVVIWGIVVAVLQILDYVLPALGARWLGGSKWGTWGSVIGLLVGMFFGIAGIVVGPFVGAVVGELINGAKGDVALKAGLGSFMGLLVGTFAKLVVSGIFIFYYIKEIFQ